MCDFSFHSLLRLDRLFFNRTLRFRRPGLVTPFKLQILSPPTLSLSICPVWISSTDVALKFGATEQEDGRELTAVLPSLRLSDLAN